MSRPFTATGSYLAPPQHPSDPKSPKHGEAKAVQRLREMAAEAGLDFDAGELTHDETIVHPDTEDRLVVVMRWEPPVERADEPAEYIETWSGAESTEPVEKDFGGGE